MGWGLAAAELGREPQSVEEYADVMEESRRTAFRDQAAFRKAFPTESTPMRMNQVSGVQSRYDAAYRRLKEIGAARQELEALTFELGSMPADV